MPSILGFGSKSKRTDPVEILGEDPTHPSGDAEIVEVGGSYQLRPRGSMDKVSVDIPQKSMGISSEELAEEEAARKLKLFKREAQWDPNIPAQDLEAVDDAVGHHDAKGENALVGDLIENSPYPEVRAAVRNYDVDLPCNTFRAWAIGMIMTTIGSALNMLFSMRSPSITITSIVAQLVAYPIGVLWAMVFPDREFHILGCRFNLSPGPFNYKEHALIVLMANAAYGGGAGYFTDILQAQVGFYGFDWGWGFAILLGFTTQCVGFGLAGIYRAWLVEPASMIWPANLVSVAFMYTLHDHSETDPEKTNGWRISRYRYFLYVFIGAFVWYWFPGYIAQFLSVFAFATWIAPNNVNVNKVFGGFTGMSLIPITFDWTQVTGYVFSPLIPPWHAIMNTLIGMVIFYWITAAGVHFSGTWYAEYLPFSDSSSYDNTQSTYNVSRVLNPDFTLNLEEYKAYSPLYLSTTFALCYGLSFAAISSVVVHTALFHGRDVYQRLRAKEGELDDIHARMMRKYKTIPWWWFMAILIPCVGASFAVIYAWPTGMPWWSLVIAFLISAVWMIPIGMVQAITNVQLGLNVFTEFIIGYMVPGKPNAMMLFKTYGYITMTQGLYFAEDMKLGHYLKLPPRTMFFGQLFATLWSCVVQTAVFYWAMGAFEGICTTTQSSHFTCPNGRVFFNASVIWGLIGPARIFSGDALYTNLQYFWLAGAALPVIVYLAARKWPKSGWRYINAPLIFGGTGEIPPATPLNYLSWGLVGLFFNYYIRNRWRGWWMRFNYITSAALDSGLAISTIVIVLTLSLTGTSAPDWWGNNAALSTMDALDTAITKVLNPGETFGLTKW